MAPEGIGQQQSQAGAGVGFDHEENGFSGFGDLFGTQRGEDTMVDGVVEEQDFCRLNQNAGQRQELVIDQPADACAQCFVDHGADRTDGIVAEDGQDHAQDTGGEVVVQHLKAAGDLVLEGAVDLLHAPAGQGAHGHGAQEHGDVGTDDNAHGGDGTDHGAAGIMDHLASGVADEQRKKIDQHGGNESSKFLVGGPSCFDEQGGNKSPGDECADVGHHHAAEKAAEFLNTLFHYGISSLLFTSFSVGSARPSAAVILPSISIPYFTG